MDGFSVCVMAFIAFLAGIFWFGGWNEADEIYKACLDKKEVVVKNIKFKCIPDSIIVQGKEVPYQ